MGSSGRRERYAGDTRWSALLILGALALGTWFLLPDDRGAGREPRPDSGAQVRQDSPGDPTRRAPPGTADDPRIVGLLRWERDASAGPDRPQAARHVTEGLGKLAGAIAALAVRDSAGGLTEGDRIAALDSLADRILNESSGSRQTELTRTAFVASATLLQEMHRRRFPNAKNEVVEARLAANQLRTNSALRGQERAIDHFFERAAIAVRRMSVAR
jgi:hypothetical protein